jgi:hypothetical protein
MIAIYARKSTEQTGVADQHKSVAGQVEHARAYAQRRAGPSQTSMSTSTTESAAPGSRPVPSSCG